MKAATMACGVLALAGALWQFAAYAAHVGGVAELFTAGGAIRALWTEREITIPFYVRVMATFGHAGVVLALTAWSTIGRRWWMALPLLAVVVFSVSIMGRLGILMLAVDVFLITYYRDVAQDARSADKRLFLRFLPALCAVVAIFSGGEILRSSSDLEANVVTRTFASYAFSGPSGLTEWLKSSRVDSEPAWGAQSFDSVAAMIGAKEQLVGVYDDYAQLSVRHDDMGNIYTVVRPLVEDFGLAGACVFMVLFGLATGFVFERTQTGSLPARALSCALGLYTAFTVIAPLTVFSSWILSAIIPTVVLALPIAARAPAEAGRFS
jgi:oligosaccharide repeat unit polymerase